MITISQCRDLTDLSQSEMILGAVLSPRHTKLLASYLYNLNRGALAVRDMIIADLRMFLDLGAMQRAADMLMVLRLFLFQHSKILYVAPDIQAYVDWRADEAHRTRNGKAHCCPSRAREIVRPFKLSRSSQERDPRCFACRSKKDVDSLEGFIKRLRKELENSDMATGRDAMATHALHLDLARIVDTWKCMGETTFGVLEADLREIDAELRRLSNTHSKLLAYPGASAFSVDPKWQEFWRHASNLGDPNRPRLANVYPGLATAGIVAPLPGGPSGTGRNNSDVGGRDFLAAG